MYRNTQSHTRPCRTGYNTLSYGFSLLQMSMALMIIAFLTGGILTGKDLIQLAEQRSIIAEIEQFKTAAVAFHAKYNAVAGDMKNATTYWGDCGGCGGGWPGDLNSTATNNGNGNGKVDGSGCTGADFMSVLCDDEPYYFWKHLVNAGMIKGSYTGTLLSLDSNSRVQIFGQNVPASRI